MTESTRWSRWPALMALVGWLLLAATYFLYIPIFHRIWLFIWLAIGVGWLWAVLWSFTAVMSYLSIAAYVRAGVVLVLAVVVGAGLWNTEWITTSIKIEACTSPSSWIGEARAAVASPTSPAGRGKGSS